jgi:mevalonate kinase
MKEINLLAYGKWILAGEHSVLRGAQALVFPLESCSIQLKGLVELCLRHQGGLSFTASGHLKEELPSLLTAVLNRGFDLLPDKNQHIQGELHIENTLPFGAGLGASASVCVLITKLFCQLGLLPEDQGFSFARQLENIFHGESSGVDIAATLVNKPIVFNRYKGFTPLSLNFKPLITLHYTGRRGVTRDCIDMVKKYFLSYPEKGAALDEQMKKAVEWCQKSLESCDYEALALGIELACDVYKEWGLLDSMSESLRVELKQAGALAVKPTGSGLGGYLLALWEPQSTSYRNFDCLKAFSSITI